MNKNATTQPTKRKTAKKAAGTAAVPLDDMEIALQAAALIARLAHRYWKGNGVGAEVNEEDWSAIARASRIVTDAIKNDRPEAELAEDLESALAIASVRLPKKRRSQPPANAPIASPALSSSAGGASETSEVLETIAPATTARAPLRLIDCAKQRREADQRETRLILQAMYSRALEGKVGDLVLCFKEPDGTEHWVRTGVYDRPAEAVNAANRLIWRLAEMQES